jgi:hypothetical protein
MEDILEYVADMTQQLADLCREVAPTLAACLELASKLARERV